MITTIRVFQPQRRLAALGFVALALVALPAVASAQCHSERLMALTSGTNPKFTFMGFATGTFANLNPVANGITVNLNGTPEPFPTGAWAGAGTAGWVNLGDNWKFKDSDGIDPKYKAVLKDAGGGEISFKASVAKSAMVGALTGSVGANSTPAIAIDASGEGCTSDFVNDEMNAIQDCRYKPGIDPTKVGCRDID